MNDADFQFIATLLKDRSGLIIGPDKLYLLEARLSGIVRAQGMKTLGDLVAALRLLRSEPLILKVVDAMTTNETSFFRDHGPFDKFRQVILPALVKARADQRRLRIWSAACSTGQEPYSLAMLLKEQAALVGGWRIEIIATDISERVLERARNRTYSTFEVQRGMPVQLLTKYFEQAGSDWKLKAEVGGMVDFRICNLLGDLKGLGSFDLVFCRNVLIYFDPATKRTVLSSLSRQIASDGFLLLGGSESMYGVSSDFTDVAGLRGVYCRADSASPTTFNATSPAAALRRAATP